MIVDLNGNLVFADGRRIRKVLSNGTIITIAGTHQINEWEPPRECSRDARLTSLRWPTDLAFNPIDHSLYFLDGDDVLIWKPDGVILRPLACYSTSSSSMKLNNPKAITFSPQNGLLYIVAAKRNDHGGKKEWKPTILSLNALGDLQDFLKQTDFSWFSDLDVRADGSLLARYLSKLVN